MRRTFDSLAPARFQVRECIGEAGWFVVDTRPAPDATLGVLLFTGGGRLIYKNRLCDPWRTYKGAHNKAIRLNEGRA